MPRMKRALMVVCAAIATVSGAWSLEDVQSNAVKVADWMLAHPRRAQRKDWSYGTFYAGLMAFGLTDPSLRYLDVVRDAGRTYGWKLNGRPYHADDHCVGQAWLACARLDDDPAAEAPTRAALDFVLDNRSRQPIVQKSFKSLRLNYDRWCWSDALFMAPPVWTSLAANTGDDRYRDFMISEYRATLQRLYDADEHLVYRDARAIGRHAKNGRKVFWSRGCGWVFAGLPLILRDLPADLATRPVFENVFKEMAAAIKDCPRADGAWSPNLLDATDPDLPEMSGTAFFCYGLVWGVNNGLLDAAVYLPVAQRAWVAMNRCVDAEGRFGWVQPAGDRPAAGYGADSTEVYAVGGYLLAAAEIRKHLVAARFADAKTVTVSGGVCGRPVTVEIPLKKLDLVTAGLVVWDERDGAARPFQLWDADGDGAADTLLFQTTLAARVPRTFKLFSDASLRAPMQPDVPVGELPAAFLFGDAPPPPIEHQRTLGRGPVRTAVETRFRPVDLGDGRQIRETRVTTFDHAARFVRHVSTFAFTNLASAVGGPALPLGAAPDVRVAAEPGRGWLAVAAPAEKGAAATRYATVIRAGAASVQTTPRNDIVLAAPVSAGESVVWYVSDGVSHVDFPGWQTYVRRRAAVLPSPPEVMIWYNGETTP